MAELTGEPAKVLTVEMDEHGQIAKLPGPLQKLFDSRIAEARRDAEARVETKMSPYLADPVELERLKQRDQALKDVELKEKERAQEYAEALKMREAAHAEAVAAEKKRTELAVSRVRDAVNKSIRAEAASLGARGESLDELEVLLSSRIDLDDTLTEFVKDADGKPAVDDKNQRVTVKSLVADYLAKHPHHVAAAPGQGGGARGGATLAGRPPVTDDRTRVLAEIAERPTVANVAKGFAAITKRAS